MSGGYVEQELGAEFGKIPPSFLPLSNKRLFQHQVALNHNDQPIYIALPDDFQINDSDRQWLNENKVNILAIDSQLSLGQAIVTAWNLLDDKHGNSIRLLLGDTLFKTLPSGYDLVSVSQSYDNYHWSHFGETGLKNNFNSDSNNVVCGYFSFSNSNSFIRELVLNKFDFIAALEQYRIKSGLSPVAVTDWLDFGHINTYYKSKVQYTTQRAFNALIITADAVEKSSAHDLKIKAESNWFESIPTSLRLYTPQLLKTYSNDSKSYKLEYLYNTALNELFIFSSLPKEKLFNILSNCLNFVDLCKQQTDCTSSSKFISELFIKKTEDRINQFTQDLGFNCSDKWRYNSELSVSVKDILADINHYLPKELPHQSIMHGDLCFSNIIYDFRTDRVKVIDPRGVTHSGELTIYGDYRYDIAKLSHSILGLYDWIIAGYFDLKFNCSERNIFFKIDVRDNFEDLQDQYTQLIAKRYSISELSLYAMQIHLFLSMLPLHKDNTLRQHALFANAFRLYKIIKDIESC